MTHGHDACNAATKQLIRGGGTPCAIAKRKKKRVERAPHIPTTIPTLDDLGIGGGGGGVQLIGLVIPLSTKGEIGRG